jgi:hypothetical protein
MSDIAAEGISYSTDNLNDHIYDNAVSALCFKASLLPRAVSALISRANLT